MLLKKIWVLVFSIRIWYLAYPTDKSQNFKMKLATCHSVIDWIDKVQSLFFMHFKNIDHGAMLLQLGCIFNNRKCHFNLLVFSI